MKTKILITISLLLMTLQMQGQEKYILKSFKQIKRHFEHTKNMDIKFQEIPEDNVTVLSATDTTNQNILSFIFNPNLYCHQIIQIIPYKNTQEAEAIISGLDKKFEKGMGSNNKWYYSKKILIEISLELNENIHVGKFVQLKYRFKRFL